MSEEEDPPSGQDLLGVERSPFAHPQWAIGMVLVLALPFLVLGLFGHPIWLLLGSPFLLVLAIWIGVKLVQVNRPVQSQSAPRPNGDDA
jgi:hypothetical protein